MSGAVWKGFNRSNVIGKVFCGAVWKGHSHELQIQGSYYKLIDLSHYELKPAEPTKGEIPLAEVLRFNTKVDCLILNRREYLS
uniref:Uncharacterized protein n=1 Tax=Oryza rufipogon TaxID=4529 RepID=A0A0E0QWF8_ORYRU